MTAKHMKSNGFVGVDAHDCNCARDPRTCPYAVTPRESRNERVPSPSCPELLKHPQTLAPAVTKHFGKGKQPEY